MSNKRYINQIRINPSNLNNIINAVSDYLHKTDFKPININGETFFANNTINKFNWVLCLKFRFNGTVAFIEGWLVGLDMAREPKFNEEYGIDSMYGYLWSPITMLKAVIRDVESLIKQGK
ncbi:hypothetical protein psyc5s11_08220 [Clostridium gelidum]|uniref:Uncharacterized protein n=1 Tax=Clostridium gelidum TaxID=704125 RepID=A0ABN6IRB9_9CLOT|nr:hypothetical protein [Clostridium gelidum]BCZ44755.1 hypothetical protein psyc5s11_08220 [Clostridium gelidum]